jgi:hypothetical protein
MLDSAKEEILCDELIDDPGQILEAATEKAT